MITIGREEGVRALWSGFVPRLLWSATFFAVGISTYEAVLGAYAMLSCHMLSCLPSFLTTICLPSFLTSSLPSPCCTLFPLSRFPLPNRCELCVANVWDCYPAVCPLCVTVKTVTLSPFAWPPGLLHFPRVALRSLSRALRLAHTLSRNRLIRCAHDSADHQVGCGSGRGRQGPDAQSSNTSI
jgi:hypothetical protein